MESRLDLDYCPRCDLPTFDHETVVETRGVFYHAHCYYDRVMVVARRNLNSYPFKFDGTN